MDEKEERLDAERREERAPRVLKKATKEQPWQNSLGMKFVPVAETQVRFKQLGYAPGGLSCIRRERRLRRDGRHVLDW